MRRWVTLIELVLGTVLVAFDQLPVACELSAAETPPSLHGIYNALGEPRRRFGLLKILDFSPSMACNTA
jgi:hypothetical protein